MYSHWTIFLYKLRLISVGLFNGSSDVALLIHLSFIEGHNGYMHCKQYYTLPTYALIDIAYVVMISCI